MFSKFNYRPGQAFYHQELNQYLTIGKEIFSSFQAQSKECLNNYIYNSDTIDGSALKEHWFKIDMADIFLSHSHKDINQVTAFAGWLYENFGLISFIDSCTWGYCNDLLRLIDNRYCKKDSDTYDYDLRNYTTSHVHMMLSTALSEMIDNTECIIFFNTPNSISMKHELSGVKSNRQQSTDSPWIFHELSMTTMIRQHCPRAITKLEHRDGSTFNYVQGRIDINYNVQEHINKMNILSDDILRKWKSDYDHDKSSHSLDLLYSYYK